MKRIIIAGALIFAASAVNAAQLSEVEGKAFVSKGAGFSPVAAGSTLVVGDRVMVSRESSARISFADGCSISVQPGQVISISKTSPCAGGEAVKPISFGGRMGQSTTSDDTSVVDPTLLVIGGVAIVGGTVAFIATRDSDKKVAPKSP